MLDKLETASALGGYDETIGAVRIAEVTGKSILSVSTPLGGEASLAAALKSAHGADVPGAGRAVAKGGRYDEIGQLFGKARAARRSAIGGSKRNT